MSADALLNGAPAMPDLWRHRGLHYGDGVFRTCLMVDAQVIDLGAHVARIKADATRLGFDADAGDLERDAMALAAGQRRGILKMLLLRAGDRRGYRPAAAAADRLLCRYPLPPLAADLWERGVSVARSAFGLATQPALAGIKHLNRLEQVLASRDWPAGADELLLADADDRPVCGTRTNLFWVARGVLHTPALERCGVAGLMRERVLTIARELGVDASIDTAATWPDVEGADEVFLTNSVIGIWPVAAFGARRLAAPGTVTCRLATRLAHPRAVAA